MSQSGPAGHAPDVPRSGPALIRAMTHQYESASREAAARRRALAAAGGTAGDALLEVEVAPDGAVQRCTFSDRAKGSSPARLSTSFMTLYLAAVTASTEAVAASFADAPGIGEAIRHLAPRDEGTTGAPGGAPRGTATGLDGTDRERSRPTADGDDPIPLPDDADLDHWSALFDAHDDPVAGLNAVAADPAFQAARPGGDPHRWQQDLTAELTRMVEAGRRLMPELSAITATADSRIAEVTVTPTGAVRSLRFHAAVSTMTAEEAATALAEVLRTARHDAAGAADALLAREGMTSDLRTWEAPDEL